VGISAGSRWTSGKALRSRLLLLFFWNQNGIQQAMFLTVVKQVTR
jgi:hypothetical protein